jgi:hypothetical protein
MLSQERHGISEKSKHFGIKASFVQDLVTAGVVTQEHVDTKLNVADLGTKVVTKRVFADLRETAMGREAILMPTKRVKTVVSEDYV